MPLSIRALASLETSHKTYPGPTPQQTYQEHGINIIPVFCAQTKFNICLLNSLNNPTLRIRRWSCSLSEGFFFPSDSMLCILVFVNTYTKLDNSWISNENLNRHHPPSCLVLRNSTRWYWSAEKMAGVYPT